MGILSAGLAAAKRLANKHLGTSFKVEEQRSTSSPGVFAQKYGMDVPSMKRRRTLRYRHISFPIPDAVTYFIQQGLLRMAETAMWNARGTGHTYNVGINRVKRAIRALPKRERRAARTAFIHKLRASGIK